jgi:hypothetical protein
MAQPDPIFKMKINQNKYSYICWIRWHTNDNGKIELSIGPDNWLLIIPAYLTAMIGYHIHHSIGWAIMDFFFAPWAWAKWLIMHQVTLGIIHSTFAWFFAS